jgi:hypothetical protein
VYAAIDVESWAVARLVVTRHLSLITCQATLVMELLEGE